MSCWYFLSWEQIQQLLRDLSYHLSANVAAKIWAGGGSEKWILVDFAQLHFLVSEHWSITCGDHPIIINVCQSGPNRKSDLYWYCADLGPFSQFALFHGHLQLIWLFTECHPLLSSEVYFCFITLSSVATTKLDHRIPTKSWNGLGWRDLKAHPIPTPAWAGTASPSPGLFTALSSAPPPQPFSAGHSVSLQNSDAVSSPM